MSAKKKTNVVPFFERPAIKPKNEAQKAYMNAMRNFNIVIGDGSAGTGKTYLAACVAADMLQDSRSPIERIVIVRPNEGPGKSIGYLKGDLFEKYMPWAAPVLDALATRIGTMDRVKDLLERGVIELLPEEYARGKSLNNAIVILDESQNISWESLKNITLRIGMDSKLFICGDTNQKDIKVHSGLEQLIKLTEQYEYVPWKRVTFTLDDCVRSDLCKSLLYLYEDANV
jgi:phosphate starvation-inducible PhoH-like protein